MAGLDAIIREYVRAELVTTSASGPSDHAGGSGDLVEDAKGNHYVRELHDCLERRGVMRELQAFLRQRLVSLLTEKWPQLANGRMGHGGTEVCPITLTLFLDFLRCKRLLFTLSVFVGELGVDQGIEDTTATFGKISCSKAEELLERCGLLKDSVGSRSALKKYYGTSGEDFSLLECALLELGKQKIGQVAEDEVNHNLLMSSSNTKDQKPWHSRFKEIDMLSMEKMRGRGDGPGVEERLHEIQIGLENDKNIQVKMAIKKFRDEEVNKIRSDLEHRMELMLLEKEKDLLSVVKERAEMLREGLAVEKAMWVEERGRQEKELEEKKRKFREKEDEGRTRQRGKRSDTHRKREEHEEASMSIPTLRRKNRDPVEEMGQDKIAFLQYNLEQQALEIQALREQIVRKNSDAIRTTAETPTSELLRFLTESKQRCLAIEEEAKGLDAKLSEIKTGRGSRISFTSTPRRPPPPPSSVLTRLLLNQKQNRQELTYPLNIPLVHPTPPAIPPPSISTKHRQQQMTSIPNALTNSQSHPQSPIQSTPPKSQKSTPDPIQRARNDSKLAKAVSQGALSFEKVTSSSEADEPSFSEIRKNRIASKPPDLRRRISFSTPEDNHNDNLPENEEPVKLVPDNNDNSEKSFSISQVSGPKSRGDDNSDFLKL